MEIFKKPGTKERLFEMMQRVNKITLNEVNEVVSKQDTKVEQDPATGSYTHNTTFTHPNKNWEEFRKKITHALSRANQSIARIYHFLHGIELKNAEESFMQGYQSITSDEEFKEKAVDDFYNWIAPARSDFEDNTPFDDEEEFNEAADVENVSDELPAYDVSNELPVHDESQGEGDDIQSVLDLPHDENHPLAGVLDLENSDCPCSDQGENGDDTSALLDPSTHWIDDYVPKKVAETNIDYPQGPDDAEAMEDRYREEQDFYQQASKDVDDMTDLEKEEGL